MRVRALMERFFFPGPTTEVAEVLDEQRESFEVAKRKRYLQTGEMLVGETFGGVSEVHWAPLRPRAVSRPPEGSGWCAMRRRHELRWSVVEVIGPDENGAQWWVDSAYGKPWPVADPTIEWGDTFYQVPL